VRVTVKVKHKYDVIAFFVFVLWSLIADIREGTQKVFKKRVLRKNSDTKVRKARRGRNKCKTKVYRTCAPLRFLINRIIKRKKYVSEVKTKLSMYRPR
jgi:hypothetical protein